jgi:hypothetical protein
MYVGSDASATIDSALDDFDGFQNEGDNEVTGIHVSDGDPTVAGLLGVTVPTPSRRARPGECSSPRSTATTSRTS